MFVWYVNSFILARLVKAELCIAKRFISLMTSVLLISLSDDIIQNQPFVSLLNILGASLLCILLCSLASSFALEVLESLMMIIQSPFKIYFVRSLKFLKIILKYCKTHSMQQFKIQ